MKYDCLRLILQLMGMEIQYESLTWTISSQGVDIEDALIVNNFRDCIDDEKWLWGFHDEGTWRKMHDEWMNDGAVIGEPIAAPDTDMLFAREPTNERRMMYLED